MPIMERLWRYFSPVKPKPESQSTATANFKTSTTTATATARAPRGGGAKTNAPGPKKNTKKEPLGAATPQPLTAWASSPTAVHSSPHPRTTTLKSSLKKKPSVKTRAPLNHVTYKNLAREEVLSPRSKVGSWITPPPVPVQGGARKRSAEEAYLEHLDDDEKEEFEGDTVVVVVASPESGSPRKRVKGDVDAAASEEYGEDEFDGPTLLDDEYDEEEEEDEEYVSETSSSYICGSEGSNGVEQLDDIMGHPLSEVSEQPLAALPGGNKPNVSAGSSVDFQAQAQAQMIAPPVDATSQAFVSIPYLRSLGCPPDTCELVQRFHQRGHEPLLPQHWQLDYPFFPDALFVPSSATGSPPPFIRSLTSARDFHATKALSRAIELSSRVRDKVLSALSPEPLLASSIRRYLAWAAKDADLRVTTSLSRGPRRTQPPLYAIHTGSKNADVHRLEAQVKRKLVALRVQWRARLRSALSERPDVHQDDELDVEAAIPTVYGVLASHTLVGICALHPVSAAGASPLHRGNAKSQLAPLDPEGEEEGLRMRSIAYFDFGNPDLDVWNALALAIFACHVRNVAVRVRERFGLGWPSGGSWTEDPDA